MNGPSITFRVEGMAAAPQGSKRHLGNGVMIESCKRVKPWRARVTDAAIATGVPMIRGPVSLSVIFLFHRPKGHWGKRGLLPSAPRFHCVKPDASKLLRSTEDALSQVLYEDDARIVTVTGSKRFTVGEEREGAIITLIGLDGSSAVPNPQQL